MSFRDQFLGKCSGVHLAADPLGDEDVETFNRLYPGALKKFREMVKALPDFDDLDHASHNEGLMLGSRVYSKVALIGRLRGVTFGMTINQHADDANAEAWILDALRDGASADYWYEFEKEW